MKIYMHIFMALLVIAAPAVSRAGEAVQESAAVSDEATAVKEVSTAVQESEAVVQESEADAYQYEESTEFPEQDQASYQLDPEVRTWAGIKVVDVEGSRRAAEYLWPHTSFTGGVLVHYSPLPSRMDFELGWVNLHDYSAEADYAYKDIVRLDYRGWSLFHNLDHYVPQVRAGGYVYVPRDDPGLEYGVTARSNRIGLRLKWPDRAFHAFASYRQYDREGTIQQRFRLSGPSRKVTEPRNIGWITSDIIAGGNGHFGPVEVEYSHRLKEFTPHRTVLMNDAGVVHNVVPERTTNMDTLKLHTDLTGRVVGSVTLVTGDKRNKYDGSRADFKRAFGDIVLMPLPNLTVAMKYRYAELQTDLPVPTPATAMDPMDTRMNTAEVGIRYSPRTSFSVKGGYKYTNTIRYGNDVWNTIYLTFQPVPREQDKHDFTLAAMLRPLKAVTARANLGYVYTHDPAYPTSARNAYSGKLDMTWVPAYSVCTNAYYKFARDDNGATGMESGKDNAGLSASWNPSGSLTVNGGYDYFRYRNDREMEFNLAGVATAGPVALQDTSHVYYIGAGYRFAMPLSLNAEFHQSWSVSRYRANAVNAVPVPPATTEGLGDVTDVMIRETGGSFRAAYELPKGWGTSMEYKVNDYQDLEDKAQNGVQDGLAHSVIMMLSKNW